MTAPVGDLGHLAAELHQFGGDSSIQLAQHKLVVFVVGTGTARQEGGLLRIRDPKAPESTSSAERCFRVPLRFFNHLDAYRLGLNNELCKDVCTALLDGFNQTLLSMGQTQLGKSTCLFGKFAWSASRMKGPCCVLTAMLRRLLAHASSEEGKLQLALSCWETSCDQVVDLLAVGPCCNHETGRARSTGFRRSSTGVAVPATPGPNLEHTAILIESLVDADKVLAFARTRSVSWGECEGSSGLVTPLPNRGHTFVRIIVNDCRKKRFSMLHIVDLAGSQPLGGRRIASLFAPPANQVHCDSNRHISKDLLSVSRMLTHIASSSAFNSSRSSHPAPASQKSGPSTTPSSHRYTNTDSSSSCPAARDTKLAEVLYPLIAGNCRVTLLATVSAETVSFLDTINTLRLACRMQNVSTCVTHNKGAELELLSVSEALPADALEVAHHVQRTHMHLYASVDSDDEEPASTLATNATKGAHEMDQGADGRSSERQKHDSHELHQFEDAHEDAHDTTASSQDTNNPQVSISFVGGMDRSPEVQQAVEDLARHPCHPVTEIAGSAKNASDCLGALPQANSDRTDLVGGVIKHGKHKQGNAQGHGADLSERHASTRNGPFNLDVHDEEVDPHHTSTHQYNMPDLGDNTVVQDKDATTKGAVKADTARHADAEAWYEGSSLDDEPDAENLRSCSQQLQSVMAELDKCSPDPGYLESDCTDTNVEPSPAKASSFSSPLPEVSTPLADMCTLVSPDIHIDAPGSSSITQPQLQLVPAPSGGQPSCESTRNSKDKATVHQHKVQCERPAVTEARCGQDYNNLPTRQLDHAIDGSMTTHSKAQQASGLLPEGMEQLTDVAFYTHHLSHHDKKENHGCNTEHKRTPKSALHHQGSPARDSLQWKPPAELATGACSYRVMASSPQSIYCPSLQNHSQFVEHNNLQGEQQRGVRDMHTQSDSTLSPNYSHTHASGLKGNKSPGTPMNSQAVLQGALDRERQRSASMQHRCKALEQDLEECAMHYEVKLDNEKLRRMEMQRVLHALQQGSDMAAVFGRYEHDLELLRSDNEQLRSQNENLLQAQFYSDLPQETVVRKGGAISKALKGAEKAQVCPETGMPREEKINALKRQVRKARLERDAAIEASEGYKKKERLYALREKQAELALNRVQDVEKEHSQQERLLARKGKILMQAQIDLSESQNKCSRLEAQLEDMRNKNASQEHELQVARKKLRQKEKGPSKSPFKDPEVLQALPALPNTSQTISATLLSPKHTKTAMQCLLHLSQKLKQDASLTVPTQRLVEKLVLAAQGVAKEESVRREREVMLVTFIRDQYSTKEKWNTLQL